MTCNVQAYIRQGDSAVADVEALVHSPKITLPPLRPSGKSFKPPGAIKLDVVTTTGRHLRFTAEMHTGDYYLELATGRTILRELHTHDCHHNPGGDHVPGCHKHFPSVKHTLRRRSSSYAYSVDCPEFNLHDLVTLFFDETMIENYGVPIPMEFPRRKRR